MIKPFRFWCQKVLPLVYDDSLSYYELLCKVVDYINKIIEDLNGITVDGAIPNFGGEWDSSKAYDRYTLVFTENGYASYISTQQVPVGTEITNTGYWQVVLNAENIEDYIDTTVSPLVEKVDVIDNNILVTPQMFGAKADGITDDTEAIKLCLSQGKTVWIPSGTYITSSRILIPENTTIFAYGALLKNTNKEQSCLEIKSSHVYLYGLEFTEDEGYGRNDFNTSVILIHSTTNNPIFDIGIRDCYIHNTARYAINIASVKSVDDVTVVEVPCSDILIEKCNFNDVWVGVKMSHSIRCTVRDCYFEDTQAENLTFDDGTEYSIVDGCKFGRTYGGIGCIGADTSYRCRVTNSMFRNRGSTIAGCRGIAFNQHTGSNRQFFISNCIFEACDCGILSKDEDGYTSISINTLSIDDCYFNANGVDIELRQLAGVGHIHGNIHRSNDENVRLLIGASALTTAIRAYKIDERININLSDYAANGVTVLTGYGYLENGIMKLNASFSFNLDRTTGQALFNITGTANREPSRKKIMCAANDNLVDLYTDPATTAIIIRGGTTWAGSADDTIEYTFDTEIPVASLLIS